MKICEKCGIYNSDSRIKCEDCGGGLRKLKLWELPEEEEKHPIKDILKVILTIFGVAVFLAVAWIIFLALTNIVFVDGASKDRQAVSGYIKAYYMADVEECRKYMLPFAQDSWIFLGEGIYGEFHSIGEVVPYTQEEVEELKSQMEVWYASFIEEAEHVELKYNTIDTKITDRNIESEYITVVKYRGAWFLCPYDVGDY